MTAKELINELQALVDNHGERELLVSFYGGMFVYYKHGQCETTVKIL